MTDSEPMKGPHSRACNRLMHPHGWQCTSDCPTCLAVAAATTVLAHAKPGELKPRALADAVALLEKYDDLDREGRQGQGYTMLIEVQARALVAIAEALS